MYWLQLIVLTLYTGALSFIFVYSISQLSLVYKYRKAQRNNKLPEKPEISSDYTFPLVTIQLPVYNELYVVERLIDSVAALDWPSDKLEIQVLDDSNDETVALIAKAVATWKAKGIDIVHIQRPVRKGFKAGALQYGLAIAKGEFIAIFDADFVPSPDFLKNTVPHFEKDEKIGVVQSRWGHLNENYSMLTKLQAFGLNTHFFVEQNGRASGGHFLNFNGTAGIWRKNCITDAGGWKADTLTEDLDLSYRAQLKGWQIFYVSNTVAPAELPAAMSAIKSQQYRWTKGAAETSRKLLPQVLKANLSIGTKFHAAFHLLNSAIFICIVITSLLSVPVLFIRNLTTGWQVLINISTIFLLGYVFLIVFYWNGFKEKKEGFWKTLKEFIPQMFMLLSVFLGLSFHNAVAVFEGFVGKKTPFVRTPKFNITDKNTGWKGNKYFSNKINGLTALEGLLSLYFMSGLGFAFYFQDFALLPFHILLSLGFMLVFYYTVQHTRNA
ncbi:MAG: cellulose synthase/poly-beta-1,6-N-acetylglucosamine synthase-like glycosyltransferase [Candidatus Endobugula sp.]|jgi:cellulose synthase/poly-beta-1,6-N-acetylglucosamine synthase-like glycosyltransferase